MWEIHRPFTRAREPCLFFLNRKQQECRPRKKTKWQWGKKFIHKCMMFICHFFQSRSQQAPAVILFRKLGNLYVWKHLFDFLQKYVFVFLAFNKLICQHCFLLSHTRFLLCLLAIIQVLCLQYCHTDCVYSLPFYNLQFFNIPTTIRRLLGTSHALLYRCTILHYHSHKCYLPQVLFHKDAHVYDVGVFPLWKSLNTHMCYVHTGTICSSESPCMAKKNPNPQ